MSKQRYKEKPKRVLKKKAYKSSKKGLKTIRLPIAKEHYDEVIESPEEFRCVIDDYWTKHEELFPKDFIQGYTLHSKEYSKKLDFSYRRIKLKTGSTFSIAPSFVMPYMVGYTSDISMPLLFKKYGAPSWLLTRAFGHNDMYWERIECSLGRNSIVGTTVKNIENLPQDYACDEKFSRWARQRIYVAMTAAKECVFGMSVTLEETSKAFEKTYGIFVKEAKNLKKSFQVRSVNLDGFHSTRKAWRNLFKNAVIILCFLHGVLKIKKVAKSNQTLFNPLMDLVWQVYHSETSQDFLDNMELLREWTQDNVESEKIKERVMKLYNRTFDYEKAYEVSSCHRTSNMIDRQMDAYDRFIYNRKYYHGHMATTELKARAWAILHNFVPFCARKKIKPINGQLLYCRAAQLNGFIYCGNWLENLVCSTSLNGFRC